MSICELNRKLTPPAALGNVGPTNSPSSSLSSSSGCCCWAADAEFVAIIQLEIQKKRNHFEYYCNSENNSKFSKNSIVFYNTDIEILKFPVLDNAMFCFKIWPPRE